MGICQRLIPMATTGDGNCLLHAASLGKLIPYFFSLNTVGFHFQNNPKNLEFWECL